MADAPNEQPIDVDAYEAAGVARVDSLDEPPDEHECLCQYGYCQDPDEMCHHCMYCCICLPCEYGRVA